MSRRKEYFQLCIDNNAQWKVASANSGMVGFLNGTFIYMLDLQMFEDN